MSEDGDATPPIADLQIVSTRVFDFPRDLVFRAWTEPVHLAHWWGPKGFTNSFHEFDLRPGGNWRFAMHGPDGVDYKNHSVFVEIVAPERIVFDHVSGPHYRVTANGVEIGAGWVRRRDVSGEDYVSLSLATPEFGPRRLYANLAPVAGRGDAFVIIWNPPDAAPASACLRRRRPDRRGGEIAYTDFRPCRTLPIAVIRGLSRRTPLWIWAP